MISGDSLRGIRNAETSLMVRSQNIANVNTEGYKALDVVVSDGSPRIRLQSETLGGFSRGVQPTRPLVDTPTTANPPPTTEATKASVRTRPNDVDLAKDMVGMQQDRRFAGYNLQAMKVQDRMAGDLLDLVG